MPEDDHYSGPEVSQPELLDYLKVVNNRGELDLNRGYGAAKALERNPQLLDSEVKAALSAAWDKALFGSEELELGGSVNLMCDLVKDFTGGLPDGVKDRNYFGKNLDKANLLKQLILSSIKKGNPVISMLFGWWDLPRVEEAELDQALIEGIRSLAGKDKNLETAGGTAFDLILDVMGGRATSEPLCRALLTPEKLDEIYRQAKEYPAYTIRDQEYYDRPDRRLTAIIQGYHKHLSNYLDERHPNPDLRRSFNLNFRRLGLVVDLEQVNTQADYLADAKGKIGRLGIPGVVLQHMKTFLHRTSLSEEDINEELNSLVNCCYPQVSAQIYYLYGGVPDGTGGVDDNFSISNGGDIVDLEN